MKSKDVIKGIEEGFDDNEKIADAVEWVEDAANRLAELEQDNHMQAIKIEKMQAEIDALKVAQTWQPIESAPRDARLVLLRVAHGSEWAGVHAAHWSASKHAWMYAPDYAVPRPTHWMPLPPAPETAK